MIDTIASRLANVFNKYCKNPTAAAIEAQTVIDELFNALGGCDLCYGKGYNVYFKICDCQRGQKLRAFIKNYKGMPDTHPPLNKID